MRIKRQICWGLLLFTAVGAAGWLRHSWQGPRRSGLLRQDVYVWQRAWTAPVRKAVREHAGNFAVIAVLRSEISWTPEGRPKETRIRVNHEALARSGRPVALVIRIEPYGGPFEPGTIHQDHLGATSRPSLNAELAAPSRPPQTGARPNHTDHLGQIAAELVTDALSNKVALAELQIDFDCAESKLGGYCRWIEAIQRRVSPLPVTITALPSWLNASDFTKLASVATNYVLQVHSAERPARIDAPFTLCHPGAARRATERAGRVGVPFRVALPTYGYLFAFEPNGDFLGLAAEGPRPNWPSDAVLREVESNPDELAALIERWTRDRPAAMRGVIWYRLPVESDRRNWSWQTLASVMQGEAN